MIKRSQRLCKLPLSAGIAVLMGTIGISAPASATENVCAGYTFSAPFALAEVSSAPGGKAHFYKSEGSCPAVGATCTEKAYLVPGDVVATSIRSGKFVCAWFQPAKGKASIGWLSSDGLSIKDAGTSTLAKDWVGKWKSGRSDLEIKPAPAKSKFSLHISGATVGSGAAPSVGDVEADGSPRNGLWMVSGDGCTVKLTLLPPYLVASDSGFDCGGLGTSFNGVYRK